MNNKIYFSKMRAGAVIPSKRLEDGAFDIYACLPDVDYIILKPHETALIPTGLASVFSSDYVAILKERGSTGSNGLGQRAGVIDSGYRGEWFVAVTNHNDKPLVISNIEMHEIGAVEYSQGEDRVVTDNYIHYSAKKAITSCVMVQVPKLEIAEISNEELADFKSERGTGALGSSGK